VRTNDITVLVPAKTAAPTPQRMATRGTVTIPPASITDDTVTVTLPSYSPDYGWPCRWIRQGNTLPAIGAECLVLWDEAGAGTVVQWAGAGVALPTLADVAALAAAPPQARVYNSASISVATSGVSQALTFDSERFDNGGLHSTSADTSRLTAPTGGLYLIGGNVSWSTASGTGTRYAQIRLNGTTIIEEVATVGSAAFAVGQAPSTTYQLTAGWYVELVVQQTSGGALSVATNGNASPEFWMVRLGPAT
jgi:hypothetical protein